MFCKFFFVNSNIPTLFYWSLRYIFIFLAHRSHGVICMHLEPNKPLMQRFVALLAGTFYDYNRLSLDKFTDKYSPTEDGYKQIYALVFQAIKYLFWIIRDPKCYLFHLNICKTQWLRLCLASHVGRSNI